jgi:hypothetical protein
MALRAIHNHQPRRFFLAFFPKPAFAADAPAGCFCPAWAGPWRFFFLGGASWANLGLPSL